MNAFTRKLKSWNRRLNLHVVTYFSYIDKTLKVLTLLVSLFTILAICYFHGYDVSDNTVKTLEFLINGSIIFYLVKYVLYSVYTVKRKDYIKQHILSGLLILFLIINLFIIPEFGSDIEIFGSDFLFKYYPVFLQFFFLIISAIELMKACSFVGDFNFSPSTIMLTSFVLLIGAGTLLLMMPRMSNVQISFVDALFTSTSASCVTGLTVVNTGTDFTFRGQIIIMLLIQFGGISILSFATFFAALFSQGTFTLKQSSLLRGMLATNKTSESVSLLKQILVTTFFIEALGTGLLFIYWNHSGLFSSSLEAFYYSLFHSISAFNNAGFSLWNDNLTNPMVVNSYFPQFVIIILIILGGLGFFTIRDIFNPNMIRERKKFRWKKLRPSTYIIIYTTTIIIVVGSILYFILEKNHSLKGLSLIEQTFTSLFQIVTCRSAGFNTVDMRLISLPALLVMMFVMFIGASPGSTAGGIKTTTAFVIYKSIILSIRQYKRIEFRKKTIPFEIADKSYSIVMMSALFIGVSVIALSYFEHGFSLTHLLFESISAFGTCGLTIGITTEMSDIGKLILVSNMFIGRIGTLSIAIALSKRIKPSVHQYPSTYFMVG